MLNSTSPSKSRILGISGSFRRDSFNTALLRACGQVGMDAVELKIATFDTIPIFNDDDIKISIPTSVLALAEEIRRADAVVIATPEYNFSVPGGLKNALDWVSRLADRPFQCKPVAVMGASTGKLGSARAQYHLRQILQCLEARVISKPEVFVASADLAFVDGNLVDPEARRAIKNLVQVLLSEVKNICLKA